MSHPSSEFLMTAEVDSFSACSMAVLSGSFILMSTQQVTFAP